ncbi:hypothetical protein GALLR39Z86_06080 [Glycomyces algeriensis]|uniref:Uncharacterized protein n=1 Tax=Glycomyces algeriensis TaxID=256037 RepID=A0A9W6G5M1_9ACTN|nr:hypothetical protein GALLR39Z86_06080 [Glycomyces algeriensis]
MILKFAVSAVATPAPTTPAAANGAPMAAARKKFRRLMLLLVGGRKRPHPIRAADHPTVCDIGTNSGK